MFPIPTTHWRSFSIYFAGLPWSIAPRFLIENFFVDTAVVNFLLIHDLDFFTGDGEGHDERDTLILRLELKWQYRALNSPRGLSGPQVPFRCPSHRSRCPVTVQVDLPASSPSFLFRGSKFSRLCLPMLFSCPHETGSRRIHSKVRHLQGTSERPTIVS